MWTCIFHIPQETAGISQSRYRTRLFVVFYFPRTALRSSELVQRESILLSLAFFFVRRKKGFASARACLSHTTMKTIKEEDQLLLDACGGGNIIQVKHLLREFPDININAQDYAGRTALWFACRYNYTDITMFLLGCCKGTFVDLADIDGMTPFSVACYHGHTEVAKLLLLCQGTDVNWVSNLLGETPLLFACRYGHTEIVKLLLDRTADIKVNNWNTRKQTPLWVACHHGHIEIVRLLLARDDVIVDGIPDKYGETHMYHACLDDRIDIIQELLQRMSVSKPDFPFKQEIDYVSSYKPQLLHIKQIFMLVSARDITRIGRKSSFRLLPTDLFRLLSLFLFRK